MRVSWASPAAANHTQIITLPASQLALGYFPAMLYFFLVSKYTVLDSSRSEEHFCFSSPGLVHIL